MAAIILALQKIEYSLDDGKAEWIESFLKSVLPKYVLPCEGRLAVVASKTVKNPGCPTFL